jgi:hypothetical protein
MTSDLGMASRRRRLVVGVGEADDPAGHDSAGAADTGTPSTAGTGVDMRRR